MNTSVGCLIVLVVSKPARDGAAGLVRLLRKAGYTRRLSYTLVNNHQLKLTHRLCVRLHAGYAFRIIFM